MDNLFTFFETQIDWVLFVIILISSFWVKKNFEDIFPKVSIAHKILIWCTLLTIAYVAFLHITNALVVKSLPSYCITYFFATSFYELLWKYVVDWVTKKLNGNTPPQA